MAFLKLHQPSLAVKDLEEAIAATPTAHRYFHLDQPNVHAVVQDARYWLATQPADAKYDVIIMDAYQQPYLPFYLATREFFRLVRERQLSTRIRRRASAYRALLADPQRALAPRGPSLGRKLFTALFIALASTVVRRLASQGMERALPA